ncbi:MAG TPA: hypothetical protein VM264_05970 [Acidimicrobiales bacterium]|nr:hypothetical protein [Acidimicrobiales bacterium]
MTTGSTVDTVDASPAPSRSMPAKNVVMATTVETMAMATTAAQLPAVAGNAGRCTATMTA